MNSEAITQTSIDYGVSCYLTSTNLAVYMTGTILFYTYTHLIVITTFQGRFYHFSHLTEKEAQKVRQSGSRVILSTTVMF